MWRTEKVWTASAKGFLDIDMSQSDNSDVEVIEIKYYLRLIETSFCQGQQEGTQMQNERNKYLLKHKTLQGGAQGWTVLKLLQTAGEN